MRREKDTTSTTIIETGRKLCPAHRIWCFCNGMKLLADVAQEWANRCAFQHRPKKGPHSGLKAYTRAGGQVLKTSLGENLAMGTGMSISQSIQVWDDEKVDYDLGSNSCKPNRVCGHYTQDVWAMTRYVGCAYKKGCNLQGLSATYHVCNYYPPGNFNGRPPYTAGQPATACPQGTSPGTFNGKSICVDAQQPVDGGSTQQPIDGGSTQQQPIDGSSTQQQPAGGNSTQQPADGNASDCTLRNGVNGGYAWNRSSRAQRQA